MKFLLCAATALALLAGCAVPRPVAPTASPVDDPCAAGEASYACQVERYNKVNE